MSRQLAYCSDVASRRRVASQLPRVDVLADLRSGLPSLCTYCQERIVYVSGIACLLPRPRRVVDVSLGDLLVETLAPLTRRAGAHPCPLMYGRWRVSSNVFTLFPRALGGAS